MIIDLNLLNDKVILNMCLFILMYVVNIFMDLIVYIVYLFIICVCLFIVYVVS